MITKALAQMWQVRSQRNWGKEFYFGQLYFENKRLNFF